MRRPQRRELETTGSQMPELGATGIQVGWHVIADADLPEHLRVMQELDEIRADWFASRSRRGRTRTWQRLSELQPILIGVNPHDLQLSQANDHDVAVIVGLVAAAATEPDAAVALVAASVEYWATCSVDQPSIDIGAIFAAIRSLPAQTPALLTRPLTVILRQAVREGDETAFRPLIRTKAMPARTLRIACLPNGHRPDWIRSVDEGVADVEDRALTRIAGVDMLATAGHLLNPKKRQSLAIFVGADIADTAMAPSVDETRRRHCVAKTQLVAQKHGLKRAA